MTNSTLIAMDTIIFLKVEDRPENDLYKKLTIISVCSVIMITGLVINRRIYKILSKRSSAAAMDRLLKFNNVISLALYPIILGYYMGFQMVAPVSDYIGVVGCILTVHLIDVFTRFYSFTFPIAVALLRYLFVVKHIMVKARGLLITRYASDSPKLIFDCLLIYDK